MTAETAPEVVAPAPEPEPAAEPDFVVVPRDQVDAYASAGWQVGYAMLRPE